MNSDPKSDSENAEPKAVQPLEGQAAQCACIQDPFAALPPELRPRQRSWKDGLRKVICPGCGFKYWTNRKTDLCVDCEKKGVKLPEPKTNTGGG